MPKFDNIVDLIKQSDKTEWGQAGIDVIDSISFIGAYFEGREITNYTAADLLKGAELILQRKKILEDNERYS
jgi:hypothetical protein